MKITLMGRGTFMGLPRVLPRDLDFGNYYIAVVQTLNDSGEEDYNHDMMFVAKGALVNSATKQPTKILMFLKTEHKCTLSQLGDPITFFGPINVDLNISAPDKVGPKSAIGAELDPGTEKIGDHEWTNADNSVHKDK